MSFPCLVTRRDSRSSVRSPTVSVVGSAVAVERRTQRLHAREQFGERERLGEVVVAAGLQAAHAIVHGVARAEDQHRHALAAPAQRVDQREAVETGQAQIDDGDVGPYFHRERQAALAIAGHVHREARLAQAVRHELGKRLVVFDDERAHGWEEKSPAVNCTAGPMSAELGKPQHCGTAAPQHCSTAALN